jgi:hypothetical protein
MIAIDMMDEAAAVRRSAIMKILSERIRCEAGMGGARCTGL